MYSYNSIIMLWYGIYNDNQPLLWTKECTSQWCPSTCSLLTPASYLMALYRQISLSVAHILKLSLSPKWESNHAQVFLESKQQANKSFFCCHDPFQLWRDLSLCLQNYTYWRYYVYMLSISASFHSSALYNLLSSLPLHTHQYIQQ